MADKKFKYAAKEVFINYIRKADGLSEDTGVETPPKFMLDAKF